MAGRYVNIRASSGAFTCINYKAGSAPENCYFGKRINVLTSTLHVTHLLRPDPMQPRFAEVRPR